jgi:hypothetical protein
MPLWTRSYGVGARWEWGNSVKQTTDGGYIIVGYTWASSSDNVLYIIKTDTNGDTLWTRTFGGANDDGGQSVKQTSDGGYIVAGWTDSFGRGRKVYLIKTDSLGYVGVESSPRRESRVASYGVFPNPFTSFASVPGHSSDHFSLYDISRRKVGTYKGDRIGEGLVPGVYFLWAESRDGKPVRVVKVR